MLGNSINTEIVGHFIGGDHPQVVLQLQGTIRPAFYLGDDIILIIHFNNLTQIQTGVFCIEINADGIFAGCYLAIQDTEVLHFIIDRMNLRERVIAHRLISVIFFTIIMLGILLWSFLLHGFLEELVFTFTVLIRNFYFLFAKIIQIAKQFITKECRKILIVLEKAGKLFHNHLIELSAPFK